MLFEMLQPRVHNLFHSPELPAPHVPHIVKPAYPYANAIP